MDHYPAIHLAGYGLLSLSYPAAYLSRDISVHPSVLDIHHISVSVPVAAVTLSSQRP